MAGLITGQDLIAQIKEKKEEGCNLGDTLLIPSCMLRTGEEVFLDDITVTELEKELGIKVVAVESGGRDFIEAVVSEEYHMERVNDSFGYVKAYD